jgi:ribosomal protein S18 acetylase RimI-like enzyme
MPISTRTAVPADYDRIAEVTRASFLAGPYGHIHSNPERERFELDVAARAAWGAVLVALDGDRIVGATSLLRAGTPKARLAVEGDAEIRLLAVDPDAQGSGIGEALVRASIAEAKAWGARRVVLDTGSRNERAQRLYLRAGFQRTNATIPDEPQIDSFTYSYDLADEAGTVIRLIRPQEFAAVGQLTVDAYSSHYDLPPSYLAELADVAGRARDHEVWVLEDRSTGRIAATVATPRPGTFISELGREGELDFRLLAVAPDASGHGYGAALTRHVIGLAVERGLTRVVMNSGDMMLPAHALYAKLGFYRIPERDLEFTVDGRTVAILTFGYDV